MRAKEKVVFFSFPFEISISIFLHISAWYQFVLSHVKKIPLVFKGVGEKFDKSCEFSSNSGGFAEEFY